MAKLGDRRHARKLVRKAKAKARRRYKQIGFETMHKKTRWVKQERANGTMEMMERGDHEALAAAGWHRVLPPDHPDYVAPDVEPVR